MNWKDELIKTGLGLLTFAIFSLFVGFWYVVYLFGTRYLPTWAQIAILGSIIVLVFANVFGSIFYEVEE